MRPNNPLRYILRSLLVLLAAALGTTASAQVSTNSGSGLNPTYPDLAAAITALNSASITSPVVITLTGNETAPAGGYVITAEGSATNTITIQGSGSTLTASGSLTAGNLNDGIFKLVGGDWITIQGFTMQENPANTTTAAASNNMTEWGVALLYASNTNGAQNNTIQNNTIALNRTYGNTFGVYSNVRHIDGPTSANVTTLADIANNTTAPNSGNKVYGNTISNVNHGIVFVGSPTAANMDQGNDIGGASAGTGNNITAYGGLAAATAYAGYPTTIIAGAYLLNQNNFNLSFNSFISASLNTATALRGILTDYSVAPIGAITNTVLSNTVTFTQAGAAGVQGITTAGGFPMSNVTTNVNGNSFVNNVITGNAGMFGIANLGQFGTLNMNNNIVSGNTSAATTLGFTGITNQGAVINTINIQNNQVGTESTNAVTFSTATTAGITGISNTQGTATTTLNITGNFLRRFSLVTTGQFAGIIQSSANIGVAINLNNNNLGTTTANLYTYSGASTNTVFGIVNAAGAATATLNMTGNNITGLVHTLARTAGGHNYYNNQTFTGSTNISNNTITNVTDNSAGTSAVTMISNSVSHAAGTTHTVSNNAIVGSYTKTGGSGQIAYYNSFGSSSSAVTEINNGNNFSNMNFTGTTGTNIGWRSADGATPGSRKTVTNNTFSNITGGTGAMSSVLYVGFSDNTFAGNNVSGNVISNITNGNSITGIFSDGQNQNFFSNTIAGLSATGASAIVNGISLTGATVQNVFKNKIYDLQANGATATVNGIVVSAGATVNIHNNLIGDLRAPSTSSATDAVRGISITSATANATNSVFYNTIYLNATSSGANFSTAGVFHTANATATTGRLELRNNSITNLSTPNGTGNVAAFRRSSGAAGTLSNYAASSNNNMLYAGTPGASTLIYADGTSTAQTLTDYQNGIFTAGTVAPRDAASVSGDITAQFLSTSGASPLYLHMDPFTPTILDDAGSFVASVLDDFDGNIRSVTTPEIGADEILVPCVGTPTPGNTTASVSSACVGQSITLGLQNASTGDGISYAWEFDNGGGWTAFGTNAPTQVVTQSVGTSYRCTVSCSGGGSATSGVISVPMSAPFPVDFAPLTFAPNCWSATVNANLLRAASNAFSEPGSGSAQWNFYSATNNTILSLTSPTFTPVGAGQQIRFDVAGTTYTGGEIDSIAVEVSSNGGTTWALLQGMSNNVGGLLNTAIPQTANFVPTGAQWNRLAFPVPAGTDRIRFRGRSNFGNSVYIDNIVLEPVPTCVAPSGVAAIGTSTTTANLTWNGTGNFIVEYGPAATFTIPGTGASQGPEGTSTVVTGVSSPYTIPGLVHPTQYRVYVRRDCTGSNEGYSINSPGITFYSQPPYDQCESITSFPSVGAGGSILLSGNNFGATDSEGFGQLVSWEAFTLTSCVTTLNIDYCGSTPARTNAFVNLFVGCPQSAGFIPWTGTAGPACPNGSVNVPYANVPAGTYYIAIMNQTGASGPYGITVTAGAACPPAPDNDLCSNATPITCGQTLSGTTVNATTTGAPATLCNGLLNNTSGGVWYQVSGVCGSVTASLCTTVPTWNSKLAVYSGACGSLTCVTTNDDFCGTLSQATWTADASLTYYIYVLGVNVSTSGTFDLALTCANTAVQASATAVDDCANDQFSVPVNITGLGGAASATINYSVNGTPQTPLSGLGIGVTNLGPFAAGAEVAITVSNGVAGCATNLGSYYSNCPVTITCGSTLVVNHCYTNNDTRTWTFNSPVLGETVTVTFVAGTMAPNDVVRIYDGVDNTGSVLVSGNFASLPGVTATSTGQSIFIEIDSDASGSCFTGGATSWQFEVECTAGCTDPDGVVSPNVNCATYSFTLDIEILGTGDAATTDLVYTVNGGSPITIPGLDFDSGIQTIGPWPIGTTINVVLEHETDGACNKNLGNFTPGLACPPPGTSCALPFQVNSYPFTQSNTTCGKGNNVVGTQCGLGANYGGGEDFVYQLNISSAGDYQISVQLTGGASFAGWFLKSSTNCGNASQCIANSVTTAVNGTASSIVTLAAGTYYVIVDSRPLPNCVAYNISITQFVALPGDNCTNAISLATGLTCTPTAGSVAGMTQTIAAGVCGGTADDDIWYSFVATATSHEVILDAAFDAVLEVRSGACNGVNIACADNNFSTGIEQLSLTGLTIGATYYVRLWSWSGVVQTTPTFTICVSAPPPPYDPCTSIANISACDVPTGAVSTTAGSGAFNNYGGPFGTPGQEKIFTFTASVTGVHLINVTQLTGSWIDFFWKAVGTCDATGWNYYDDVLVTGIVAPTGVPLNFTAGTTYYIMWDAEDTGARTVDFTVVCPIPVPANDLCANAIPVACNSTVAGTTLGSTNTGNPGTCTTDLSTAGGVWYTVQGWNGQMTASLCGSGFDTKIGVFTGSCGALTCVIGNDDFCGLQSQTTWTGTQGTTYYVYVTGFGANTGAFTMTVTCGDTNPACTTNGLTLELETDANFLQTSWEIVAQGTNVVALSGSNLPVQGIITQSACLPDGCYRLRVLDAGGDGISGGGYILRTQGSNQRIIDNRDNFTTGSVSAVIGNGGFCLPLGTDKLIYTSCDKLDWVNNQFLVADPNPAVSAQWQVGNQTDDGYQFWIFDPNGTYGYTKFRNHATSDGFGPPSAIRACHMQINNWSPNQIPANVLMNVKVRSRVNGTNSAWGPVCRFKIDPVRAACPLTKLMDIPGNQFFSCNVTRTWGGNNRVYARPVDGATQYQFRFSNAELAQPVVRTNTTYYVNLNWTPALPNGTYQVQVRAFKNGAWCVTSLPWGDVCNVTIVGSTAMTQNGGGTVSTGDAKLAMFPNPNRGDLLTLSLSAVEEGVNTVSVDIYDLTGAVVSSRTIAVNDGMVYQVLELNEMASGLYMVNITAGNERYTERLVISK
ncbi:MAG: T9SS type A sorting domain-containing protein [Flavobacteriales bacterium]|nr:T9SS type A sorting domain-containing protein [Flavobacteriales bacterium]